MTLFSMGTVVLCHKWLRKQGKLDVQINVSWLKGEKNIIKIQGLTLYQSPSCHTDPDKSPGTAGRAGGSPSSPPARRAGILFPPLLSSKVSRRPRCSPGRNMDRIESEPCVRSSDDVVLVLETCGDPSLSHGVADDTASRGGHVTEAPAVSGHHPDSQGVWPPPPTASLIRQLRLYALCSL